MSAPHRRCRRNHPLLPANITSQGWCRSCRNANEMIRKNPDRKHNLPELADALWARYVTESAREAAILEEYEFFAGFGSHENAVQRLSEAFGVSARVIEGVVTRGAVAA